MTTSSVQNEPAEPYVGLRPFERSEQRLFFGRDQDAMLLCDKLLSAHVTILHAQSGVGKTSLLRAMVVPQLEHEAVVLYHDAWSNDAPLAGLKAALTELAAAYGVPSPEAGNPTLKELVCLINAVQRQPVILVLDQFEEFLLQHSGRLEPLREELGELMRPGDVEAHVLLSLREEFLATLEPFKRVTLTLFASTYRLERLAEDELHRAIREPAQQFGAGCSTELIDALLTDLREGVGTDVGERIVELPFLQLICRELWRAVGTTAAPELTLGLYGAMGRARGILGVYVRDVTPRRLGERYLMAHLLRYLAPPSGLKMSYSADDLAQLMNADRDSILLLLRRLAEHRILHVREFRKRERFELQHDTLIRVLAPWRDQLLQRRRRRQWGLAVLGSIVALLSLYVAGTSYTTHREQKAVEESAKEELKKITYTALQNAASETDVFKREKKLTIVFDQAAGYVLRNHPKQLDYLKLFLQTNEDKIPSNYGWVAPRLELRTEPDQKWPFRMTTSTSRDKARTAVYEWLNVAQLLFARGIPAPGRLLQSGDNTFPFEQVRLELPGSEPLIVTVPDYGDGSVIASGNLLGTAAEFLERFGDHWRRFESPSGQDHWVVPRWSVPIWKAAAASPTSGASLMTILLGDSLLKDPKPLLGEAAVAFLLDRVAKGQGTGRSLSRMETVAEAQRIRGHRLGDDLAELYRLNNAALLELPYMLDALANYPDDTSKVAAKNVLRELYDNRIRATNGGPYQPDRLHGATEMTTPPKPTEGAQIAREAYGETERWLPTLMVPIRASIGGRVVNWWVEDESKLKPELEEAIAGFHETFFRRFGIELPGINLASEDKLDDASMRTEFFYEGSAIKETRPTRLEESASFKQLQEILIARAEPFRAMFVSADLVAKTLAKLPKPLQNWFSSHYSKTDLKLLLRGVLVGEDPAATTIEHTDWLLGSLVFYSVAGDPLDAKTLVSHLQRLQRARLRPSTALSAGQPVDPRIAQGIDSIEQQPEQAEHLFRAAVSADREGALTAFQRAYTKQLRRKTQTRILTACAKVNQVKSTDVETRVELDDLAADPAHSATRESARSLLLCRWAHRRLAKHAVKERRLAQELAAQFSRLEEWDPTDAIWFGLRFLQTYAPGDPDTRSFAEALLEHVSLRSTPAFAVRILVELGEFCGTPAEKGWCRRLISRITHRTSDPVARLAGLSAMLDTAWGGDLLYAAQAALDITQAKGKVFDSGQRELAQLLRARALTSSAAYRLVNPREVDLREVEGTLRSLADSPAIGQPARGYLCLLLETEDRIDDEVGLIQDWLTANNEHPDALTYLLNARLKQGDSKGVQEVAERIETLLQSKRSADERKRLLFNVSKAAILADLPRAEWLARQLLQTDHEYADYIRMILASFMSDKDAATAKALLLAKWEKLAPAAWDGRLREGDPLVWHEMLIGYFLDKVPRNRIFADLRDDAAFGRSAFAHLPRSRLGMLCEAYFYEALHLRATLGRDAMCAALPRVIETGIKPYIEYGMAQFLLKTQCAPN